MLWGVGEAQQQVAPARGRYRATLAALLAIVLLGAAVAILAATGGLETSTRRGPVEHGPQEEFTSSDMRITLERAVVVDQLPGSGVFTDADAGERVFAVLIEVENLDVDPRLARSDGGLSRVIADFGIEGEPEISVYGDGDFSVVTLQPGVPARLLLSWMVDDDQIGEGDDVHLTMPDAEKRESTLTPGTFVWDELPPSAVVVTTVEDLGEGREDGRL
jgi:hypothetical protein